MYVYDIDNLVKNVKLCPTFDKTMNYDGFYISFSQGKNKTN